MIKQVLLSFNFILIASLLTGTVFEIRDSVVYSFKAPASVNAPTPDLLPANKNIDQNKAINDNTDLNMNKSNLTAITNDTNSTSLSMNNSPNSDLEGNTTYKMIQEVQAELKEQGISIPIPFS